MKKKQQIEIRPNYFHGQLLLEEDFLAEQSYHINARRRHNLNMHGSGVVRGLEVVRKSESTVIIKPGYAIDKLGQEIILDSEEEFELKEFAAKDLVNISLTFQDSAKDEDSKDTSKAKEILGFAVISAADKIDNESETLLARVQLDESGKVGDDAIDFSRTKYAGAFIRPGSITVAELSTELKTGWVTMQFRPFELENIPEGESKIPPIFRVGPTETITPRPEKDSNDKGAAGSMAIPIPPAAKKIKRFRIAGARNEGEIIFWLVKGGWDLKKNDHLAKTLLEGKISKAPFMETYELAETDFDPEYQTITIWIRCNAKSAISFVSVEVAY